MLKELLRERNETKKEILNLILHRLHRTLRHHLLRSPKIVQTVKAVVHCTQVMKLTVGLGVILVCRIGSYAFYR